MALNRRHFVAASAAASQTLFAQNDQINVGMIGVGNRGAYVMRGVMQQPGTKVLAVCDIKPDRLDSAATAAGTGTKTYKDYRKLLEQKDLNAVYISTPVDLHVEMAIAALQAGKHVYCEKPLGLTAESIGRLLKVARNTKLVFQVGQQMRSMASLRKSVEAIEQGMIGKVLMIKAQRHAQNDMPRDSKSADWFFDVKRSGGYLIEMSVHNLDACNWAAGARPEMVSGFGDTLLYKNDPPGRTIMDGYGLTYDYPNGVKLSYTQLVFHPRGLPNGGQYIYVYGAKGAIDLMNHTMYPSEAKAQPVPLVKDEKDEPNAHTANFLEAIRTGKKPVADIEIGARAALTAIMGHESMMKKRVMSWKDLGVEV
jgi:myo-inositol 2-dehydrogenase / D-chiro-inositol 1-dehydrogenase